MSHGSGVRRWLERASPAAFTGYATFAAFATYFCMYAFRKAFAAATFAGKVELFGLPPADLKVVLIIAQALGYAASKFLGIKIVSELSPAKRAATIVALIAASEVALVGFAVVPAPWSAVFLTLNGLPLGMIWGLVFGFLEGRKTSDLLGVGLCVSFIVASGFVKFVGKALLDGGVPEVWMPSAVGALFFVPLLAFVWLLAQIPPPTAEDEAHRTKRAPMTAADRRAFFLANLGGLVAMVAVYTVLSTYRDFRDNFARELWDAVGFASTPSILATAELPVGFGALLAVGAIHFVKDNRRAVLGLHAIMFAGGLLVGVSTLLFDVGAIGPVAWMIAVGLGLYVGYVPFNAVLFDRLIAALGSVATAGFLIYVADAFGYLGCVGVLLYKTFGQAQLSWLEFFRGFSYVTAVSTTGLYVVSALYFARRAQRRVEYPIAVSSLNESAAEPMK